MENRINGRGQAAQQPLTTQEDLCCCRRWTTITGREEPLCLPTSSGEIPTSYVHGYITGNGCKTPLIIAWHARCVSVPGASAHLSDGLWGWGGGGGSSDSGDTKLPYQRTSDPILKQARRRRSQETG